MQDKALAKMWIYTWQPQREDGVGVGVEQQHSHNCKNLKRWEFFISVTLFFVKDMDKTFVFALS